MSKLNQRGTKPLKVTEHPKRRPVKPTPEARDSKGHPKQRAYENRLARKHEDERNATHKDIQRKRAK